MSCSVTSSGFTRFSTPKETKNTEKEKNQLKPRVFEFGAPKMVFPGLDDFSANENRETDRFGQKGAVNEKFGTNAVQRIKELEELLIDFKLRTAQVEQMLKRTEKFNVEMKTAIRRIVSTKRDLKSSLAVLTDANADLPRHRRDEDRGVECPFDADRVRDWSSTAFNSTPGD